MPTRMPARSTRRSGTHGWGRCRTTRGGRTGRFGPGLSTSRTCPREKIALMAPPFRIGVMQLTMEPLEEMLESARVMDRAGMDTIWLAEAYPWWRKHGMEARSSTVVSGLIAKETERLTVGWGIISPFTRHPVQVAMDARVVQEAAGPGRFLLGFGTSKIFLNNARLNGKRTLGPMADAVAIVRGVLSGEPFAYEGDTWSADVPGLQEEALTPRHVPPVYVAATAPKMQALAGEIADGCKPIAGTPADCIAAIEEYREAGCTHVMLELWGDRRHEQIELFGHEVLPHFR